MHIQHLGLPIIEWDSAQKCPHSRGDTNESRDAGVRSPSCLPGTPAPPGVRDTEEATAGDHGAGAVGALAALPVGRPQKAEVTSGVQTGVHGGRSSQGGWVSSSSAGSAAGEPGPLGFALFEPHGVEKGFGAGLCTTSVRGGQGGAACVSCCGRIRTRAILTPGQRAARSKAASGGMARDVDRERKQRGQKAKCPVSPPPPDPPTPSARPERQGRTGTWPVWTTAGVSNGPGQGQGTTPSAHHRHCRLGSGLRIPGVPAHAGGDARAPPHRLCGAGPSPHPSGTRLSSGTRSTRRLGCPCSPSGGGAQGERASETPGWRRTTSEGATSGPRAGAEATYAPLSASSAQAVTPSVLFPPREGPANPRLPLRFLLLRPGLGKATETGPGAEGQVSVVSP